MNSQAGGWKGAQELPGVLVRDVVAGFREAPSWMFFFFFFFNGEARRSSLNLPIAASPNRFGRCPCILNMFGKSALSREAVEALSCRLPSTIEFIP